MIDEKLKFFELKQKDYSKHENDTQQSQSFLVVKQKSQSKRAEDDTKPTQIFLVTKQKSYSKHAENSTEPTQTFLVIKQKSHSRHDEGYYRTNLNLFCYEIEKLFKT